MSGEDHVLLYFALGSPAPPRIPQPKTIGLKKLEGTHEMP
jgi:hypothetical protein